MPRINFNACNTVGDIERLHRQALPGKLLIEFDMTELKWKDGKPYNDSVRMPIFGIYANERSVVFETEKEVGKRELIAFHAGLMVVTSIVETGDIFWSPDNHEVSLYTIDGLNETDFDFDGLLRTATEVNDVISLPLSKELVLS